ALWGLFFWATSILPVTAEYSLLERGAVALVCANVLAAFSPAVVIGLINETRATGPLSQLCMSIVVLADLGMVILFSLSSTFARSVFPVVETQTGMTALLAHIFGSIAASGNSVRSPPAAQ
ncbi:MAG TPA: hypothetical protein VFL80_03110, partial [Thermoanaerobaculia bacterium]|nr:hypothetical protein [Thermoanaerobaculia bacterium]